MLDWTGHSWHNNGYELSLVAEVNAESDVGLNSRDSSS